LIVITRDLHLISDFLLTPEIFRYAAEFGVSKESLCLDSIDKNEVWLAYIINDRMVGLINLEKTSGCAVKIHPYILKEHKVSYKAMIRECYTFIGNNIIGCVKVNAVIACKFKRTIEIAKELGMKVEGEIRDNYQVSENEVCDSIFLGITKDEMVEYYG